MSDVDQKKEQAKIIMNENVSGNGRSGRVSNAA